VIDRELPGYGELPPDWALQDPGDYTDALGAAVRARSPTRACPPVR